MALHRNPLGRGLDSLISMDDTPARGSSAINDVPLDKITPNPEQPRYSPCRSARPAPTPIR